MLSNISYWEAGSDIKKEKVKILWHQHSLKISDQKIRPHPHPPRQGQVPPKHSLFAFPGQKCVSWVIIPRRRINKVSNIQLPY